jgi:hypothetical protein
VTGFVHLHVVCLGSGAGWGARPREIVRSPGIEGRLENIRKMVLPNKRGNEHKKDKKDTKSTRSGLLNRLFVPLVFCFVPFVFLPSFVEASAPGLPASFFQGVLDQVPERFKSTGSGLDFLPIQEERRRGFHLKVMSPGHVIANALLGFGRS